MSEVATHDTLDDAWTVFRGLVYNITPYLQYHPGGVDILGEGVAGCDCTELFDKYHKWVNAHGMIGDLVLGVLDNSAPDLSLSSSNKTPASKAAVAAPTQPAPSAATTAAGAAENTTAEVDAGAGPWHDVADAHGMREADSRLQVCVDGRYVALLRSPSSDRRLYAIDATCYHMGGPLLMSEIEDLGEHGECIKCPWHHYNITLDTGERLYQNVGGEYVPSDKGPQQRVHEALDNLTPADVYEGRAREIRTARTLVKRSTLRRRRRYNLGLPAKKEDVVRPAEVREVSIRLGRDLSQRF